MNNDTKDFIVNVLCGFAIFILILGLLVGMGYGLRGCYVAKLHDEQEVCPKCGITMMHHMWYTPVGKPNWICPNKSEVEVK